MRTISSGALAKFLDETLFIDSIPSDNANNGLQIEGKNIISKILFGVDACLALFQYAAENEFDFVFVHHGNSWGDELKRIYGINAKRLSVLFKKEISLYAAHLPLDSHPILSHNAIIAKKLGLLCQSTFAKFAGAEFGVKGEFKEKISLHRLLDNIHNIIDGKTLIFGNTKREIRKVAIIAGSAGSNAILEAARQGMDCFITGEINHSAFHIIRETGIVVITTGHYASEKLGVIAVMEKVSRKFKVKCEFHDLPTGM